MPLDPPRSLFRLPPTLHPFQIANLRGIPPSQRTAIPEPEIRRGSLSALQLSAGTWSEKNEETNIYNGRNQDRKKVWPHMTDSSKCPAPRMSFFRRSSPQGRFGYRARSTSGMLSNRHCSRRQEAHFEAPIGRNPTVRTAIDPEVV